MHKVAFIFSRTDKCMVCTMEIKKIWLPVQNSDERKEFVKLHKKNGFTEFSEPWDTLYFMYIYIYTIQLLSVVTNSLNLRFTYVVQSCHIKYVAAVTLWSTRMLSG